MATALASLYTGVPVRSDTAMTGEITLTGLVLPVGGIKEKVLAARRAGIRRVILPRDNEKDLRELPDNVRAEMQFTLAERIEDVLAAALPDVAERLHQTALARGAAGGLEGFRKPVAETIRRRILHLLQRPEQIEPKHRDPHVAVTRGLGKLKVVEPGYGVMGSVPERYDEEATSCFCYSHVDVQLIPVCWLNVGIERFFINRFQLCGIILFQYILVLGVPYSTHFARVREQKVRLTSLETFSAEERQWLFSITSQVGIRR